MPGDLEERLLNVVRELARELHPGRRLDERVDLDAALDRDLGLDSLSRVELMMRLEKAFGVSLPEQLLASAETPRDLLRAIDSAAPSKRPPKRDSTRTKPHAATDISRRPEDAKTLTEVLAWHVDRHADRTHVHLYESSDELLLCHPAVVPDTVFPGNTSKLSQRLLPELGCSILSVPVVSFGHETYEFPPVPVLEFLHLYWDEPPQRLVTNALLHTLDQTIVDRLHMIDVCQAQPFQRRVAAVQDCPDLFSNRTHVAVAQQRVDSIPHVDVDHEVFFRHCDPPGTILP